MTRTFIIWRHKVRGRRKSVSNGLSVIPRLGDLFLCDLCIDQAVLLMYCAEDGAMRIGMLAARIAAVAGLVGVSVSAQADALMVKTEQGKVHGKTINDGKVKAFLGLPYAAPPVGDRRWKAPEPPAKWKGERDASKYGAHCAQNHVFEDMIFQDGDGSEDCLFLNVYAPADATAKNKLPVMFSIHAGGFSALSTSQPLHNPSFPPSQATV